MTQMANIRLMSFS